MTDHPNDRDLRLRALLRQADPARDGGEPDAEETARLRRRVLSQPVAPDRAPVPPLRWAAAAAALLLVLALAAGERRLGPRAPAPAAATALAATRQIHFRTPGGTQIVWVLQPSDS